MSYHETDLAQARKRARIKRRADVGELATSVANYLTNHPAWEKMTPRHAAEEAVRVLCDDYGAAMDFIRATGLEVITPEQRTVLETAVEWDDYWNKRGDGTYDPPHRLGAPASANLAVAVRAMKSASGHPVESVPGPTPGPATPARKRIFEVPKP